MGYFMSVPGHLRRAAVRERAHLPLKSLGLRTRQTQNRMETRYASSGAVHVAFQVHGSGRDLVYVPGWVSHLEMEWDNVLARRFYEQLASFTRLIRFDKRGTGMSDREELSVGLEQRIDDIVAVMDAAGSATASLFGFSEGGAMAAAFAARHPERVERLILFASHGGRVTGGEDFPCGYEAESAIAWMREVVQTRWGQGASMEHLAPSMWSHRQAEQAKVWMARFERMAATPGAALAHFDFNLTRLRLSCCIGAATGSCHCATVNTWRR